MRLRTMFGLALALACSASVLGQDGLKIGDQAPGLDIEKWVKGNETALESGNVYVVEFWATWCGPCKKSIPHLSELQAQYGDEGLTIIGVSSETEVDKVTRFVKSQGDKMDYTVAVDRQEGTKRAWFDAADQKGIPCAFVVDRKGRIAFIGNPLPQANSGFDETLKKVMSGRYDAKLEAAAAPAIKQAQQNRKVRNWQLASKNYDQVIELDPAVFANVALDKFEMLLVDMDDREKAYEYARNGLMGELFASDAEALQMLAEKIAVDPKISKEKQDLDFALEAAEASQRIAGDKDAKALASVALIRFHRGEVDQAIDLQKKAYFAATPKRKDEFKRTLTIYQEHAQRVSSLTSGKPS